MMLIASDSVLDLRERLKHIARQEQTKYGCHDYLYDTHSTITADQIVMANTAQLVRWEVVLRLYEIVDGIHLDRETVSIAVSIIDRYLASILPNFFRGESDLPFEIDLIGLSALYIAIKSHVGNIVVRRIPFIEKLDPTYSKENYVQAEIAILTTLNWDVNFPSPVSIVRDLVVILPAPWGSAGIDRIVIDYKDSILQQATYFTELAVMEYSFVPRRPSSIALAAMMVAIESHEYSKTSDNANIIPATIQHFISMVNIYFGDCLSCFDEDVQLCYRDIQSILQGIGHFATFGQYSHEYERPSSPPGPEIILDQEMTRSNHSLKGAALFQN